jgi:hypothetical protein
LTNYGVLAPKSHVPALADKGSRADAGDES